MPVAIASYFCFLPTLQALVLWSWHMLLLVFLRSAHLCFLCCPFLTSHPPLPDSLFLLKLMSFQSSLSYEFLEHHGLPLPSHLQLCVSYLSPRRKGLHLLCSCVKHMIGAYRCSINKFDRLNGWVSDEWVSKVGWEFRVQGCYYARKIYEADVLFYQKKKGCFVL